MPAIASFRMGEGKEFKGGAGDALAEKGAALPVFPSQDPSQGKALNRL